METIKAIDFSLKHTVESAQPLTFVGDISKAGMHLRYQTRHSVIEVEQHSDRLSCTSLPDMAPASLKEEIVTRFGLKDNMKEIYKVIETDAFMTEAIAKYRGMHITKNEPWETTVCFIVSQFNNVRRIKGIVNRLIENYGELHSVEQGGRLISFRSFPTPEALARVGTKRIMRECGAGFRAKYIVGSARMCIESFDLNRFYKKDYVSAKEEIMELQGVGDKVADCILLMGYKKLEAFPIDTWIKRVVENLYFEGKTQSIWRIHEFADEKWGKYAGYAQQYLFHTARINKLR